MFVHVSSWSILLTILIYCCSVTYCAIVTPLNCTNEDGCYMTTIKYTSDTESVLLYDYNVFKSDDECQHWRLVIKDIYDLQQFESDPKYILATIEYNVTFYSSTDGGSTFTKGFFPDLPAHRDGILLHPSKSGWMAIFPGHFNVIGYYTKDFGVTWDAFGGQLASTDYATWSGAKDEDDLFFALTVDDEDTSKSFSYTRNYGETWEPLFTRAVGFYQSQHFLFVAVEIDADSRRMQLYASNVRNDPSHTVRTAYARCDFLFGSELFEDGYSFLDDSYETEFIGVALNSSYSWGGLFSSDFSGAAYTLSLPRISALQYDFDFDPIQSLKGVYIANQVTENNSIRSLISFDNGGGWRLIAPPKTDTKCYANYPQSCSLNLHGVTSYYNHDISPVYSNAQAVALVLAVGNTGKSLIYNMLNLSTYITRDGGQTWSVLWNEATTYDFGDHGGLIVFGPNSHPTTTVYYSTDEGLTINSFNFSTTPLFIINIFTVPSGESRKFLLHATDILQREFLIGLDFTDVFKIPCDETADYEEWSPSDGELEDATCFMGATTVYIRRKQSAQCFNNLNKSDHVVSQKACPCDWEDYECELGFEPSSRNSTSGFSCAQKIASSSPCATGFKLVPGTLCTKENGLDLASPINCTSPPYSTSSGGGGSTSTTGGSTFTTGASTSTTGEYKVRHAGEAVGFTFLFLLLGVSIVFGVLYWKNPRFQIWVISKFRRNVSEEDYAPLARNESL